MAHIPTWAHHELFPGLQIFPCSDPGCAGSEMQQEEGAPCSIPNKNYISGLFLMQKSLLSGAPLKVKVQIHLCSVLFQCLNRSLQALKWCIFNYFLLNQLKCSVKKLGQCSWRVEGYLWRVVWWSSFFYWMIGKYLSCAILAIQYLLGIILLKEKKKKEFFIYLHYSSLRCNSF